MFTLRGWSDASDMSSLTGCPFSTTGFLATGDETGVVVDVPPLFGLWSDTFA